MNQNNQSNQNCENSDVDERDANEPVTQADREYLKDEENTEPSKPQKNVTGAQYAKFSTKPLIGKKPEAKSSSGYFPERQFRKKRGTFATIDNVLSKVVSKLGLDRRLKEHAFMGLWPIIVGDFFAQKSRPIFIDSENVLVVTVKDASVGQELSLMKREIVRKLRQSAQGLGIIITNVRFDLKHFHSQKQESDREMRTNVIARPEPSDEQLQEVVLDEVDLMQLAYLAEELRTNTDQTVGLTLELNLSERMATLCERELRLKKWRQSHDFPKCSECASAVSMLYGAKSLCTECFYGTLGRRSI